MNKKTLLNSFFLLLIVSLFPLLWYFNQRLNYRKFLTLNTKFSIFANQESVKKLSSSMFILKYFENKGIKTQYDTDFMEETPFGVLGRALITEYGNIEIYEYSSNKDASNFGKSLNTYVYKNLVILDKTGSPQISKLLMELTNAKMD